MGLNKGLDLGGNKKDTSVKKTSQRNGYSQKTFFKIS